MNPDEPMTPYVAPEVLPNRKQRRRAKALARRKVKPKQMRA